MSGAKYLSKEKINEILGILVLDATFLPMSQDTYNETAIIEAIARTKKQGELHMAAINLSCIGYGGQKYGLFKLKNEIIDIATLLKTCNVKLNLPKDSKLAEIDLTPQRLCRAFRNHTREYIREKGFETYLYRKYTNHNPKFAEICFRGAEYLDDLNPDEIEYLTDLYIRLDRERGTQISDRIQRIFQAKGYLKRKVP
jgi:hypothetical protein